MLTHAIELVKEAHRISSMTSAELLKFVQSKGGNVETHSEAAFWALGYVQATLKIALNGLTKI